MELQCPSSRHDGSLLVAMCRSTVDVENEGKDSEDMRSRVIQRMASAGFGTFILIPFGGKVAPKCDRIFISNQ